MDLNYYYQFLPKLLLIAQWLDINHPRCNTEPFVSDLLSNAAPLGEFLEKNGAYIPNKFIKKEESQTGQTFVSFDSLDERDSQSQQELKRYLPMSYKFLSDPYDRDVAETIRDNIFSAYYFCNLAAYLLDNYGDDPHFKKCDPLLFREKV